MLIRSLRRLALVATLTALTACDEPGPPEEPPTPPLDAQADAEPGAPLPQDAGAPDWADAASPPAPQPDAAALEGADAGAPVDAAVDATTDAADAMSAGDAEVPLVAPCSGDSCCMPLVSKSKEPSTVCQTELCLAQQQTFYVGGDGEMRVINSCGEDAYSRLFSYHKNGGIASAELYARGANCQYTDASALRAGIWKVVASGEAFDARTFEWSAVTLIGPGSVIQELEIKDGHLRLVIEGAITAANTIGAISPDCLHGEFIPIGLCNCRHEGAGPRARFVVDLLIRN